MQTIIFRFTLNDIYFNIPHKEVFFCFIVGNHINFALEYAIRRVQVNQDGLKLNGTHQLLAYADDVNILGGGMHTLKENAALVAATREIRLEVSAKH